MSEPVTLTPPQSTTLVIGMAAVLLSVAVAWWHQRVQGKNKVPTKWRRVGEVSEMTIYPLKSGRGVDLKEAYCTELGLRAISDKTTELLDRYFYIWFLVYNVIEQLLFGTCLRIKHSYSSVSGV